MPNTVISWVNILSQVQTNDLDLLGYNNHPNRELNIIGVDYGETDLPHIDLVEPETDIEYISDGTETLPELVKQLDIPSIEGELDQHMDILPSLKK